MADCIYFIAGFALKGKVEDINSRHLTIDLRGCAVQDSPESPRPVVSRAVNLT